MEKRGRKAGAVVGHEPRTTEPWRRIPRNRPPPLATTTTMTTNGQSGDSPIDEEGCTPSHPRFFAPAKPKRCFSRIVEERYSIVGGSFSSSPRFPDGVLGVMGDERVEIGGIVSNISHSCIKKEERKEGIILILGSVFHRECTAIS